MNKGKHMKKMILMLALVAGSANAFGADICSNQEGSIIYDSAMTFGNSVVYENPRLLVAGKQALILTTAVTGQHWYYGSCFCKAMGFSSGEVGDIQDRNNNPIAAFDSQGALAAVGSETLGSYGIKTVTCKK